ncbi:MAG: branched-chain amino acid aminotransferase [Ruminococcaceae bacterium]|nr:branched-chain amino acid aminotransferase [Oscillospiraceae bacterium]
MNISITKTTAPKTKPQDESKLGFGNIFSDHMFLMDYEKGKGWFNARIVPFENLSLNPACAVFHYGPEVFEGLKAYRTAKGNIQLFRPIENVRRMNNSADRICLPQMDEKDMLKAIKTFVEVEKDWVPHAEGTSFYIRPFIIGVDETLGVHTIQKALFVIIGSPSGSYYPEGINPVKIMIETEDVRAVVGGTGYAKCGGNYAASTRAGHKAELQGYSQVLWLDGIERKYVEEVGAMNVMFKIDGTVVTPKLLGSVLPGITRKSCIELLKDQGVQVEERQISVDEVIKALEEGKLEEAWGTGTAAVVSPIGELSYKGEKYTINNFEIGETTQKLYDTLTGIQWGKIEDKKGWIEKI